MPSTSASSSPSFFHPSPLPIMQPQPTPPQHFLYPILVPLPSVCQCHWGIKKRFSPAMPSLPTPFGRRFCNGITSHQTSPTARKSHLPNEGESFARRLAVRTLIFRKRSERKEGGRAIFLVDFGNLLSEKDSLACSTSFRLRKYGNVVRGK